jgi:ABC-type nitrate/sulfonate/bicarbonate transport system substrate-binding protein
MNAPSSIRLSLLLGVLAAVTLVGADTPFTDKLRDVKVGNVFDTPVYDLPFLTWGGDVATFMANGGDKQTRPDTLFAKQGLKFNLVNGDDFVAQVKNYLEGRTPFLRGTLSQFGQACEALGKDPRTKPIVFLQLTWSVGDYMVGRESVRRPTDLKGKRVCLQEGGPHVGMLNDILSMARLKWDDIEVVWVKDITGKDGPAEKFRKDATIGACFCITPDMDKLTGGFDQTGSGAETTVKGARVVLSTQNLTHSIADVYACRKDYYDKHPDVIAKLTAAYLKATDELVAMHANHEQKERKNKALDERYTAVLKMTQDIYTKDVISTLDDAHGLISDAVFAGLSGNFSFFKDKANLSNASFQNRAKAAVQMALDRKDVRERFDLTVADLDYIAIKKLGELSGVVPEGPSTAVLEVPFIFWGGDVATFMANGGTETAPNSFFAHHDLKIKLVPGDDFDKQIKDYLEGKSPFLRGTLSMLGQTSEQLTQKDETTPVVFLQLTWSAGDHLVGRKEFRNLNDLKGKTIALQKGGPHVGMLNDILRTTKLTWADITVVWTDDVSGDKGPAEKFRKDPKVDGCFVITPEMFALTSAPATGGIDSVGDGTKDSARGAHVVVSTQHMARSIADVYACRKDFYHDHREWVDRFAAGYLKSCEELVDQKVQSAKVKPAESAYQSNLKLAQSIWARDPAFKKAVENLDDVDGLVSDAVFVGLPGNKAFFNTHGDLSLSCFKFKEQHACALPPDPSTQPLKVAPKLFEPADLDYVAVSKHGNLFGKALQDRFKDIRKPPKDPKLELYSFRIYFPPGDPDFSAKEYEGEFQRALEVAELFANTVVEIRGHSDPGRTVKRFLRSAEENGVITKDGDDYKVLADGTRFTPGDTGKMLAIIASLPEDKLPFKDPDTQGTLKEAVRELQSLSKKRAEGVQAALFNFAGSNHLLLEKKQVFAEGVGLSKPEVGYPMNDAEKARNRRVEFLIIRVDVNNKIFE